MPAKDKAAGLGTATASITHYTRHCTTQAAQRELLGPQDLGRDPWLLNATAPSMAVIHYSHDRHSNSEASTRVTQWLLDLQSRLILRKPA